MKVFHTLALAALAASVLGLSACKKKNDAPTSAPPVRVEVMAIHSGDYNDSQSFSGTVASANDATVSFAVAGTIEQLYVQEGQRVSQGQLLGQLRAGDYENARNIAQAELAEAQDGYERLKKLHDANALPDVKWVEMQQKLKQAQNAAEMASRALNETRLYSPMAGVVSRKLADRGQNVAPIEPVYEIVSTDALTIDVAVPETEIGRFAVGQQATATFAEIGDVEGKVTQKSVVADPLTRTYKVKVSIPTRDGRILPGMVGMVKFASVDTNGADGQVAGIMLPSQAVGLSNDNRTYVWVVKNGRAERRFVRANELVAGGILVESGLAEGDSVIVAGMQKVGTGSAVEIVEQAK